jgi:hypothetical protein
MAMLAEQERYPGVNVTNLDTSSLTSMTINIVGEPES